MYREGFETYRFVSSLSISEEVVESSRFTKPLWDSGSRLQLKLIIKTEEEIRHNEPEFSHLA